MMVFALAIALPLMVLTVTTTDWYVAAERARLQTMGQLTGDHLRERLDRDLSEMSAMARTLATSPSIDAQDWARFDAQGRRWWTPPSSPCPSPASTAATS